MRRHRFGERLARIDRLDQMVEHLLHGRLVKLLANQLQAIQQGQSRADRRAQLRRHRQDVFARDPSAAQSNLGQRGRLARRRRFARLLTIARLLGQLRNEMPPIGQQSHGAAAIRRLDGAGHVSAALVYCFV